MEIIEAYKTKDGQKFLNKKDAESHQIDLLGLELERIPSFKAYTTTQDKLSMLLCLMGDYQNAKAFYNILHGFFKESPKFYDTNIDNFKKELKTLLEKYKAYISIEDNDDYDNRLKFCFPVTREHFYTKDGLNASDIII